MTDVFLLQLSRLGLAGGPSGVCLDVLREVPPARPGEVHFLGLPELEDQVHRGRLGTKAVVLQVLVEQFFGPGLVPQGPGALFAESCEAVGGSGPTASREGLKQGI